MGIVLNDIKMDDFYRYGYGGYGYGYGKGYYIKSDSNNGEANSDLYIKLKKEMNAS
jgi:hypothetical protein